MKVSDLMTRRVVAATPEASCKEIAKKMLSGYFSGMPVVDKDAKVIGVVSEFDLIKAMKDKLGIVNGTTTEIMTKNPICLDENATVEEAVALMTKHHFIRLPVVSDGKLVGVISRSDILRVFVSDSFVIIQDGEITGHE